MMTTTFVIHGYKKSVHDWFYLSVDLFKQMGIPLKSVTYEVNDTAMPKRGSINNFTSKISKTAMETLHLLS